MSCRIVSVAVLIEKDDDDDYNGDVMLMRSRRRDSLTSHATNSLVLQCAIGSF